MKIFKLSLLITVIALSVSCEKEYIETGEVFFSGITNRDGNGDLNGNIDPMDWNLNTTFTSQEDALFAADNLPICTDANDTLLKTYVYPNPNNGVFTFGSIIQMDSIALKIVDDNFTILYENDNLTSLSLTIHENGDGGSRLVRMYYRVYNGACKYQGYGDLSIR
ncbi:hypothetical protein [Owenweeksia hongkongensis]|uniref:hypothetical protein n=1 Tax=Owenweeksia hongkongensis TaxID=253245 RepID=UPI003A9510B7